MDSTGTIISGASVCLFTSRVLFTGTSCSGNTFILQYDAKGIAAKYDLPQLEYFVYSSITVDTLKLHVVDSFELKDKIISDTLVLLKKIRGKWGRAFKKL